MRNWALLLVMMVAACTSDDAVSPPAVTDYFPMKTRSWFIYNVDSIVYSQGVPTEYLYELQVQVADSFPATAGGFTWLLKRSKRISALFPWTSLASWSVRISPYQAIVSEGNISYVVLNAPLQNEGSWNGNLYNDLGGTEYCGGNAGSNCDIYTITSFNQSCTVSSVTYDHTLTVSQNNDDDPIVGQDIRSEIFAYRVGLITRSILQTDYCQTEDCAPQTVLQGVRYEQTLTSYGGL